MSTEAWQVHYDSYGCCVREPGVPGNRKTVTTNEMKWLIGILIMVIIIPI